MINKSISITEARKNISKIINEVETGNVSYSIIRSNRVVACLVAKDFNDISRISPKLAQEFAAVLRDYGPALKELAKR